MGHHFARPGNRFWPALHAAGFTPHQLKPAQQRELLRCGCGITNLVGRSTAAASELGAQELRRGGRRLLRKVRRLRPRIVAVLGIGAYRRAFAAPRAIPGEQPVRIAGARLWVLPNPSGANAHYRPQQHVRALQALRRAAQGKDLSGARRGSCG